MLAGRRKLDDAPAIVVVIHGCDRTGRNVVGGDEGNGAIGVEDQPACGDRRLQLRDELLSKRCASKDRVRHAALAQQGEVGGLAHDQHE